jgi:isoleucyl-tRNA synthetase
VLRQLEQSRAAGLIGSSLQANVSLLMPEPDLGLMRSLGDDLKFVFITSVADVSPSPDDGIMIEVRASQDPSASGAGTTGPTWGPRGHTPPSADAA